MPEKLPPTEKQMAMSFVDLLKETSFPLEGIVNHPIWNTKAHRELLPEEGTAHETVLRQLDDQEISMMRDLGTFTPLSSRRQEALDNIQKITGIKSEELSQRAVAEKAVYAMQKDHLIQIELRHDRGQLLHKREEFLPEVEPAGKSSTLFPLQLARAGVLAGAFQRNRGYPPPIMICLDTLNMKIVSIGGPNVEGDVSTYGTGWEWINNADETRFIYRVAPTVPGYDTETEPAWTFIYRLDDKRQLTLVASNIVEPTNVAFDVGPIKYTSEETDRSTIEYGGVTVKAPAVITTDQLFTYCLAPFKHKSLDLINSEHTVQERERREFFLDILGVEISDKRSAI